MNVGVEDDFIFHYQGVLRLTIVEAKNLMHCDFGFFGSGQVRDG